MNLITGGRVVSCSDEGFAPAENLLATREPEFRFGVFIPGKGQEFDSWETRRHNPHAPDWVVLELGTPGRIATVDLDTHWHDGNHAALGALKALAGRKGENPAPDDARWVTLLPASPLDGHAHNVFRVPAGAAQVWTHVLLENHPDGGIARLRAWEGAAPGGLEPGADGVTRLRHAAPIPRATDGEHHAPSAEAIAAAWHAVPPGGHVNLASEALGARVVATSNNRYGHSQQLLSDAAPRSMGDGWETSRSRSAGHFDFVTVRLGRAGTIEALTVDFTYFVLNNPVALRVLVAHAPGVEVPDDAAWAELVSRTDVKALAGSSLALTVASKGPVTHVRLETFPDGGANRLRVLGR